VSKDERNLSARDVEHIVVSAVESCTDYQGPQDSGTRLMWLVLRYVQDLSVARQAGQVDPELPLNEWSAALEAAENEGPSAPELAEYARNDIIRREIETRVREELRRRGLG
jgi:hypothetical protein